MRIAIWLLCCFELFLLQSAYTQSSVRRNAIQYKLLVHDYNTLDSRYQNALSERRFMHPSDVKYGGEISYFRYINKSFNLGLPLRLGGLDSYINDSMRVRNQFFVGADLVGVYKFNNDYILPENSRLAPYLSTGIGGIYRTLGSDSSRGAFFDMQIPLVLGLNIKLTSELFLQVQTEYRVSVLERQDNLAFSTGFVWLIGRKHLPKSDPEDLIDIPLPPDRDGDGISDAEDACPDVAGLAKFAGCPDTDGDGIPDNLDACPNEPGPASNSGCPINEQEIEPKDLDILKQATDNVQFETNSAKLLPQSYTVLDKLAELLEKKPDLRLQIHGHTDNVGGRSENLILSQNRAQACGEYLKTKGIKLMRIDMQGFGQTRPLAPNTTAEGRAKNRRVEFILKN